MLPEMAIAVVSLNTFSSPPDNNVKRLSDHLPRPNSFLQGESFGKDGAHHEWLEKIAGLGLPGNFRNLGGRVQPLTSLGRTLFSTRQRGC